MFFGLLLSVCTLAGIAVWVIVARASSRMKAGKEPARPDEGDGREHFQVFDAEALRLAQVEEGASAEPVAETSDSGSPFTLQAL